MTIISNYVHCLVICYNAKVVFDNFSIFCLVNFISIIIRNVCLSVCRTVCLIKKINISKKGVRSFCLRQVPNSTRANIQYGPAINFLLRLGPVALPQAKLHDLKMPFQICILQSRKLILHWIKLVPQARIHKQDVSLQRVPKGSNKKAHIRELNIRLHCYMRKWYSNQVSCLDRQLCML